MRGSATAFAVMMLCASGATAQSTLISAGSLSLVGVQAETQAYRQSDFRLSPTLRLRVESFGEAVHPGRSALVDPYGHRRRLASTLDYYPLPESGLHLSFGMRGRPKFRPLSMSANSELRARLDAPSLSTPLRVREDVKRKAPVALAGWTTMLDTKTSIRFDAGAMAIRARSLGATALALADPGTIRSRGTSIGAVALASFVHRF